MDNGHNRLYSFGINIFIYSIDFAVNSLRSIVVVMLSH